jgi:tetratricopeptide (TPR) repeat protein
MARGRVIHAHFLDERVEDPRELPLFERAAQLSATLGDARGQGEALAWIGIFHQVVRGDESAAAACLTRARELASSVDDGLTLSYVLRHLNFVAYAAGDLGSARDLLEESTRLRRELGIRFRVAANLVGLADIAIAQGRADDARALLDEAESLARTGGAGRILGQIEAARNQG